MNDEPLISIVLPCYNGEKYLAVSIQSCINQEYQNWELIIVDDCSTDNSPAIMKSYADKDKRIKVIRNPVNLRTPTSLNTGFANAKGEYFTWTSDDNCYLPNALGTLLGRMFDQKADAIYSGYYVIDDDENCIEVHYPEEPEALLYHYTAGGCFLYKKIIQDKLNGYDKSMFLIEDYDFWLRMFLSNYKIMTIDEYLYIFRSHKSALSYRKKNDMWKAAYFRTFSNIEGIHKFPLKYQKKYWYHFIESITPYILKEKRTRIFLLGNISHISMFSIFLIIIKRFFKKITKKKRVFNNFTNEIKRYIQSLCSFILF